MRPYLSIFYQIVVLLTILLTLKLQKSHLICEQQSHQQLDGRSYKAGIPYLAGAHLFAGKENGRRSESVGTRYVPFITRYITKSEFTPCELGFLFMSSYVYMHSILNNHIQ